MLINQWLGLTQSQAPPLFLCSSFLPLPYLTMAWSRSSRITLLLIIDLCFFFVELIVGAFTNLKLAFSSRNANHHSPGYAVGSLALVADSFHMLKCVSSVPLLRRRLQLTACHPQ